MAKEVTVLALDGESLRGVRLAEAGGEWVRAEQETWPLGASAVPAEAAENDAEDGEETQAEDAAESPLAAALRAAKKKFGADEFAFAFPLSRFVTVTVRLPEESRGAWAESAAAELQKISPFPDEDLAVGAETMYEGETEFSVFAGALPEEAVQDVADALAETKTRVVRADVLELGWLRALWPQIVATGEKRRRLALMRFGGGWSLAAIDDGAPAMLRGVGEVSGAAELVREATLSLLSCADRATDEVVVFARELPDAAFLSALGALGPVRAERIPDPFGGAEGAALRFAENSDFDATPQAWTDDLNEAHFRRKLFAGLGAAVGAWALAMLVLFGVPFVYGQLAANEKSKQKSHQRQYKEVADMRARVRLVQRYSDHARGALEILKAVSDRMPPEGMTLASFQYRRGEGVKIFGEADQPTLVYDYKNALVDAHLVDAASGDETKLFADVALNGPTARGTKQRFDLDASFEKEEEEAKGAKK